MKYPHVEHHNLKNNHFTSLKWIILPVVYDIISLLIILWPITVSKTLNIDGAYSDDHPSITKINFAFIAYFDQL